MKKVLFFIFAMMAIGSVQATEHKQTEMCEVQICNKLERFSLDIFSHIKDSLGETCFNVMMPKGEAVEGKELSSESRWYQGSFNPTKKSVTSIKKVYHCE